MTSFRVFLGDKPETKLNMYDFRLDEFNNDIEALAEAVAWKCPLRIYTRDPASLNHFLRVLDNRFSMTTSDPSQVKVCDPW